MTTRNRIKAAALDLFDMAGVERTSVAAICRRGGVSNGSFFHAFATKDALAADLFLSILHDYHSVIGAALVSAAGAEEGISAIIGTHMFWVTSERRKAKFLFEQVRAEWLSSIEIRRSSENDRFASLINHWRQPLVDRGQLRAVSAPVFFAQLIGPAQILCRTWLAGRALADPGLYLDDLIDCAVKALVCRELEGMGLTLS